MITFAADERAAEQERTEAQVRRFVADRGPGPYEIPMRCRCWRALQR
jgi:hypothetical protein